MFQCFLCFRVWWFRVLGLEFQGFFFFGREGGGFRVLAFRVSGFRVLRSSLNSLWAGRLRTVGGTP